MKVVDVTEFYSQRGGGVRSHLTLKSHVLCQLGHAHLVVAPGPRSERSLLAENGQESSAVRGSATLIRVRGPSLPYDPTYHLLWRLDQVRKLIREERPDVLEIHSPYGAAVAALAAPRGAFKVRSFVWHADFIDTYWAPALKPRTGNRVANAIVEPAWAWVRRIAAGCDATFVAARWQLEKLEAHGVPRLYYLPFGVEKTVFSPERRQNAVRDELLGRSPPPTRLLLGIGRFAREKRWDVVLDAFMLVRARGLAARLVLVGDGPERDAIRRRIGGRPDVVFLGFETDRSRLATFLASADLLVHGCPYETFGLGVAEAVASGLPAVVPDAGGASELVDDSSGARYRAGDAEACAAAILSVLSRDEQQLAAAVRARAAKLPSVFDHFRKLVDVYDELSREAQRRAASP